MNYTKYNRIFKKMKQESDGFCHKEGEVKGYIKIETASNKGILRCAVHNLKHYNADEYVYKILLFGKESGKTIYHLVGDIVCNSKGEKEVAYRFNPTDLDGEGHTLHDYETAVIAAASTFNSKEALHPILKVDIFEETTDSNNQINGPRNNRPENNHSGNNRSENNHSGNNRSENNRSENNQRPIENSPEHINEKPIYNSYYNNYILKACIHMEKIGSMYDTLNPFENESLNFEWKKIMNVRNLPFVAPGAHAFAAKYHHYLFAVKKNEAGRHEKYFFGIPGKYIREEQPDGGQSGFIYWQPVKEEDQPVGYWIAAVDAHTGNIEALK